MNDAGLELAANQSIVAGDLVLGSYLITPAIDLGSGGTVVPPIENSWLIVNCSENAREVAAEVTAETQIISCDTSDIAAELLAGTYTQHYRHGAGPALALKVLANPYVCVQLPRTPVYKRYLAVLMIFAGGDGLSEGRVNISVQPHPPYRSFKNAI